MPQAHREDREVATRVVGCVGGGGTVDGPLENVGSCACWRGVHGEQGRVQDGGGGGEVDEGGVEGKGGGGSGDVGWGAGVGGESGGEEEEDWEEVVVWHGWCRWW